MYNMSTIQPRLQYNYAQLLLPSCMCVACFTCTYEINDEAYIPVPRASNDYMDKYYNYDTDLWYEDDGFTIEATEINEMYHG